jgi:hypothetical protein
MAPQPAPTPRRSARVAAKQSAVVSASVTKPSPPKAKSSTKPKRETVTPNPKTLKFKPKTNPTTTCNTRATSPTPSLDLSLIDASLAAQATTYSTRSKRKPKYAPLKTGDIKPWSSDDSSSSSSSSSSSATWASSRSSTDRFEGSTSESDEYNEADDADNLDYMSSNVVNMSTRNYSTDSRFEPGNEEYELDEFVVGDDEVVHEEWSSDDSSSSEDGEDEGKGDEAGYDADRDEVLVYDELLGHERRPSGSTIETRRSSSSVSVGTDTTRRTSGESKLFYSDPEDTSDPLAIPLNSAVDSHSIAELEEEESELEPLFMDTADVVEEITDAMALFSRRCNRNSKPLRLRIAPGMLEDEEVREVLEEAMTAGFGRKVSLEDGSKRWTIGPKGA